MPSLTSGASIMGAGSGVSALVKSASTLQYDIEEANDEAAENAFANDHSDTGLQTYEAYLAPRITQLQTMGTGSAIVHAQTLEDDAQNAVKSNVTYNIQQENIQLMATGDSGTVAGYQQKMNVIAQEYSTIQSTDPTATDELSTLESEYYSASQSMQSAQQTAATAATSLANTSDAVNAADNEHVADTYADMIKDLNNEVENAGPAGTNTAIKNWLASPTGKSYIAGLQTMGVTIPKGAAPNYFDLVNGAVQAQIQAHTLSAQALAGSTDASAPYDIEEQTQEAYALQNGMTTTSTIAGDMSITDIETAAANPAMYVSEENADGTWTMKVSTITGYKTEGTTTDVNGNKVPNVVPIYSGQLSSSLSSAEAGQAPVKQLQKLGFTVLSESGGGYMVQANTNKTKSTAALPSYMQRLMSTKNNAFYVVPKADGTIQFTMPDKNGAPQIIQIATDSKGLTGAFNMTSGKPQAMGGEYGFDEAQNSLVNAAAITRAHQTAIVNTIKANATPPELQATQQKAITQLTTLNPKAAPTPATSIPKVAAPKIAPAPTPAPAKAAPTPSNTGSNVVERAATDVGHAAESVVSDIGKLF